MSLYKDASLVMIPSAYKDGKLYSIRPTDGDGDFTFSRGSNLAATRVDVNGLIEKGRENVLLQSNSFDTTWTKSVSITTTSGQSDRDGGNDAWLLKRSDAAARYIQQSVNISGVNTFSFYAKPESENWIYWSSSSGNAYGYINVNDGTIGTNVGALVISQKATSVGNGYYRVEAVVNATLTYLRLYPAIGDGSIVGSVTDAGVFIQDAQLEKGLVATDYIETGASTAQAGILEDMPRLDYSGGASCPSLLLEPSRTNSISSSEYVVRNVLGWDINGDGAITTENNSTTSPEGLQNAVKLIYSGSGYSYARQSLTSGAGTISVYVKKGNWRYIGLRNAENTSAHSVFDFDTESFVRVQTGHTCDFEDVGNGWYRLWDYQPTAVSPANGLRGVAMCDANGTENNPTTPAGSYNYVWGFQVELGASYPTSYIPTYGASVTRSKEGAQVTSVSDLIGQTQGTLFAEVDSFGVGEVANRILGVSNGTSAERVIMLTRSNGFRFIVTNSSVNGVDYTKYTTTEGVHKLAMTYDANEVRIFVDGVKVHTDPAFTLPSSLNSIHIGKVEQNGSYANNFGGSVKQSVVFPTALTDSECIALTE